MKNKESRTARKLKIAKALMLAAAIYNICWGAVISLFPQLMLFAEDRTDYTLIMIQCIGMLVGVYGIAYYFCSRDPLRYWPLILVGLLGKVFGPLGSLFYIYLGKLAPDFLWINVFNDLIWLPAFGWILLQIYKGALGSWSPQSEENLIIG